MPRRLTAATIVLLAVQAACVTSWEPQTVTPAQAVASGTDSEVMLHLRDGTKVVLRDPAVEHDSLVGWLAPSWDATVAPVRRAYAPSEVRGIAVKKNDLGPNIVLGVVAGTALFFGTIMGAWAISCATHYCD
jgi:hypothetical protein